jgi:septation ring formation regulator EzrA
MYIHRTLCGVLGEMRDCWKTRNFAPLKGLIEEAQAMGNRMESALGAQRSISKMDEMFFKMKAELKALNEEIARLKKEYKELNGEEWQSSGEKKKKLSEMINDPTMDFEEIISRMGE